MNLYQTQHPFYCGIDLHANEMYACVIDQDGKKQLHRNFKTRQPEKLFDQLEPFGSDVIVGCESTFNWYWLCDACEEKNSSKLSAKKIRDFYRDTSMYPLTRKSM